MKVVVLGASDNSTRYSYRAMQELIKYKYDAIPVGIKSKEIFGKQIITSNDPLDDVHTISLYVSPLNQQYWYDFILNCKPKRIIFNPGTENDELRMLAEQSEIETIEACTLVMLATNQFN